MDPLDTVFLHLDRWRHLPSYQLERRADIFFSVYLKSVVEEVTGVPLEDDFLPEFPIKRDLISPNPPTNKSFKVDYALFAKDRSRVFFVELKTDMASAKRLGFLPILKGVREILLSTTAHRKYHHLAVVLARLGYLTLPADLQSYMYPELDPRMLSQLTEIVVSRDHPAVEVIYIAPTQPKETKGDRYIDFVSFAGHVSKHSDPLSKMFSGHLRKWTTVAGDQEPVG